MLFSRGYALVSAGTVVYNGVDMTEALGELPGGGLVYVSGRVTVDGADRDALRIWFAAENEAVSGYVKAGSMREATEEEAQARLKDADVTGAGTLLAELSFVSAENNTENETAGETEPDSQTAGETTGTEEQSENGGTAADEADQDDKAADEGDDEGNTPEADSEENKDTVEPKSDADTETDGDKQDGDADTETDGDKQDGDADNETDGTEQNDDAEEEEDDNGRAVSWLADLSGRQTADGTVLLTWQGAALSYNVLDGEDPLDDAVTGSYEEGWSVTVTLVSVGEHTFTVIPVGGNGAMEELAASVTVDVIALAPKPVLKVSQDPSKEGMLSFAWTISANTLIDHYTLYEMLEDGTLTAVADDIARTLKAYTLTGISTDSNHTYVLAACPKDAPERYTASNAVTFYVKGRWAYAVSTFTVSIPNTIDTSVKFVWKPRYVAPDQWIIMQDGVMLKTVDGTHTACTVTGVTPGTHSYTIAPMNNDGVCGVASAAKSVTLGPNWLKISKKATLAGTLNMKASYGVTLTITAQKNCGAPYWNIYDYTVNTEEPIKRVTGGTATSVKAYLYNQAAGNHQYVVKATNAAGQEGPASATLSLKVTPLSCWKLKTLKASQPNKNTGIVKLNWSVTYAKAGYYKITVQKQSGTTYTDVYETTVTTALSFTMPEILANGTYRFLVRPGEQLADGTMLWGAAASVTFAVSVAWKKAVTLTTSQIKTASGVVKATLKPASTYKYGTLQISVDGGEWYSLVSGASYVQDAMTIKCSSATVATVYGMPESGSHNIRARYLCTSTGEHSVVSTRSFTLLPSTLFAVKNLKAVQTEELTLTVSWTPFTASEDNQYVVKVTQGKKTIKTVTVSATSAVVKLSKGTYTVTVTPKNSNRTGIASSVKPKVIANWWKKAPTIVKYSQTDSKELTIWFKAAGYATGYALYDNGKRVTSGIKVHKDGANSYVTISNISGKHVYQICPYRTVSKKTTYGTKSGKVTFTMGEVAELTAPTNITAETNGIGGISLNWKADKAQGFVVYVKDVLTGNYQEVSGDALKTDGGWSAQITGLQAASWSVGLKPVMTKPDGSVISGGITWSDTVTVSVPGTERRIGVKAVQAEDSRNVTVTWSNPDGTAERLLIYADGEMVDQVSGTANAYIIKAMEAGVHIVSIMAVSENGTGLATPDVTVAVYDPQVLVKPTDLRYEVDEDGGDMLLTWRTSGTVDTFRVYREEDGIGVLVATVKECAATLDGLVLGDYTVYVVPVNVLDG